jgi:hypothetical protein
LDNLKQKGVDMARQKGTAKTGGRKVGTVNKSTADIKALAQDYGAAAIAALAGIVDDAAMPPAARVSAAKELLDRGYGKATQGVEVTGKDGGAVKTESVSKFDLSKMTPAQVHAFAAGIGATGEGYDLEQ